MKIYTRTGDSGTTGLFGGTRVNKDDIRVECYGTLDEANASIGLLRAKLPLDHPWQEGLFSIQVELMNSMSHLATPPDAARPNRAPLPDSMAAFCEEWIDRLEEGSGSAEHFLLPGGTEISALCHIVRTQVRRGERQLVRLMREADIHSSIPEFINRLSDLFFALSRAELAQSGVQEERWRSFIYKVRKKS